MLRYAPMAASKQFGRYRILKHLATGGMAEVLLATATGIEGFSRHVVIKQIDPRYSQSPTFVKMFLDEARLAASLHHNNIIQVHDIGKEGDTFFFAMEYIHGEDLRKLLTTISARKEKTPLEHVVTIYKSLPNAQLAIFPNSTHLISYDDPETFNGEIDRFLATPFRKIDGIPETLASFEKMMTGLPQ